MNNWISNVIRASSLVVKHTNDLFRKEVDLAYYLMLKESLKSDLSTSLQSLLKVENNIFQLVSAHDPKNSEGFSFLSPSDLENNYHRAVELFDNCLERVDMELDDLSGRGKKNSTIESRNQLDSTITKVELKSSKGGEIFKLFHANNMGRPQLLFSKKVDNSSRTPFVPLVREKPNSSHQIMDYESFEKRAKNGDDFTEEELKLLKVHPFQQEITELLESGLSSGKVEEKATDPKPFEDGNYVMVESFEQLMNLVAVLEKQTAFAIDLEHHNYRSYEGFVCLMQISTREQDYIIDTLLLRDHLVHLNSSFTDPNIVKVLHGADSDIIWLQRDFGLYIVNMFDTYFACKHLQFPSNSLAYLLKEFCAVQSDKKYQLADWRIRPIPAEMVKYARQDTHYLLFIYDTLREMLDEKNQVLQTVFEASNKLCLKVHVKEPYSESSLSSLLSKSKARILDDLQMQVLRLLHKWRDDTARDEDESLHYVLPNFMMLRIAETIPLKANQVLSCCHPVPPLIRLHANDLALMISKLKSDFLEKQKLKAASVTNVKAEVKESKVDVTNNRHPSKKSHKSSIFKRLTKTSHSTPELRETLESAMNDLLPPIPPSKPSAEESSAIVETVLDNKPEEIAEKDVAIVLDTGAKSDVKLTIKSFMKTVTAPKPSLISSTSEVQGASTEDTAKFNYDLLKKGKRDSSSNSFSFNKATKKSKKH